MMGSAFLPGNGSKHNGHGYRDINGHKLSRKLKNGLNPTMRALLAHDLQRGKLSMHHFTRQQSLAITGASTGYVSSVARLSPDERKRVDDGTLSLASVHSGQRRQPTDEAIDRFIARVGLSRIVERVGAGKVFSALDFHVQCQGDDIVSSVVASYGPDRVWQALDDLTAPSVAAE